MGDVTERSASSESSSGMDREGRAMWEDAKEERRGREGRDERESLELKRESLAAADA